MLFRSPEEISNSLKNVGIYNNEKLLNLEIKSGNNSYVIVGISDTTNPSIYSHKDEIMKIVLNSNEYTSKNDILSLNSIMDKITLREGRLPDNDYEVIVPIENKEEITDYVSETAKKSEFHRSIATDKTGVELKGLKATNPYNNQEIPVFISDYVLTGYGTGAIMAVPAHDQRDYDFAKTFDLPIIQVLEGGDISKEAWEGEGAHINSGFMEIGRAHV